MAAKFLFAIAFIFFSVLLPVSCGLEEFEYIDNIPKLNININPSSTGVTIRLPSITAEGYDEYFDNFIIFYRIYLSTIPNQVLIDFSELPPYTSLNAVNGQLGSDYSHLYYEYHRVNSSLTTSQLDIRFAGRNYYQLSLEGAEIENIISRNSLSQTLSVSFMGENPVLSLQSGSQPASVSYNLHRAIKGPSLNEDPNEVFPQDRYFLYHSEMLTVNKDENINIDIHNTDNAVTAYVSMFIVAKGRSYIKTIFSRPAFIGIFELPVR